MSFRVLIIRLLLYFSLILSLCGCNAMTNNRISEVTQEVNNLEKLCKVWGYTKYNHSVFLLGQKDWDEELLKLIPVVSNETEDEVNRILHEWFAGLGEIDYQNNRKNNKPAEDRIIVQADTGWLSDKNYLGAELVTDLSQFGPLPEVNRSKAPVNFVFEYYTVLPDFANEKFYEDMDYGDKGYRLLGLFRMWNAMEYYYPYLDILDDNWHELLPEFISRMLEGTDRHSYELTLTALGAKLRDAHINFYNSDILLEEFGEYGAPVELMEAEGKMVVWKVCNSDCSLKMGDVICKIEGKDIEEVMKHRQKYVSTTTDDKLMNTLAGYLIRSHNEEFEVSVLRDGVEQSLVVKGDKSLYYTRAEASEAYEILNGNIGLLNPAALQENEIIPIMKKLDTTEGLIIALRQYPSENIVYALAAYFVDGYQSFAICGIPYQSIPGTFVQTYRDAGYSESMGFQQYDKDVVVLMDEKTQSRAEYAVMAARNGNRVTVIGENSVGTVGGVGFLPLPGGWHMMFTCQGMYTPEMGQVQRIGLTPDIEVQPTIKGIREGRDELMEAAIEFLGTGNLEKNSDFDGIKK